MRPLDTSISPADRPKPTRTRIGTTEAISGTRADSEAHRTDLRLIRREQTERTCTPGRTTIVRREVLCRWISARWQLTLAATARIPEGSLMTTAECRRDSSARSLRHQAHRPRTSLRRAPPSLRPKTPPAHRASSTPLRGRGSPRHLAARSAVSTCSDRQELLAVSAGTVDSLAISAGTARSRTDRQMPALGIVAMEAAGRDIFRHSRRHHLLPGFCGHTHLWH